MNENLFLKIVIFFDTVGRIYTILWWGDKKGGQKHSACYTLYLKELQGHGIHATKLMVHDFLLIL